MSAKELFVEGPLLAGIFLMAPRPERQQALHKSRSDRKMGQTD
jgi:hypothetical protein